MSYSDPSGHLSMVFDEHRNQAYLAAMREVITPDMRVMDLGAGLGVLGLLAARLGAREVHMVEPAPVLRAARQLATANGLDNIHFYD